jgi:3-hydroxymyristoyl/3-hydroxydecanoyl-(acyl carrier protein) dehydratase
MMEKWHRISREEDPSGSAVIIKASAASGSPWFSGHFPGEPILPGLAILAMVKEAILGEETARGREIRVEGVRRVRFRLTVKPDEMLTLSFSLSGQGGNLSYSFKVSLDEKPVCSGIVAASLVSEAYPEG